MNVVADTPFLAYNERKEDWYMGEKDILSKRLEEYPDVFADIVKRWKRRGHAAIR